MGREVTPLHVKVAEALGLRWEHKLLGTRWHHLTDYGLDAHPDKEPQRFDTDWSATGPLIEKYEIELTPALDGDPWAAESWKNWPDSAFNSVGIGPTPLIAVCDLILALAAAGKLPPSAEQKEEA